MRIDQWSAAPVRLGIVERDPATCLAIRQAVEKEDGMAIVAEYDSARNFYEACRERHADVMLVDLDFPGLESRTLGSVTGSAHQPRAICLGSDRSSAVDAFDANGLDYLLKPVDEARIRLALRRARAECLRARVLAQTEQLLALAGELTRERRPEPQSDRATSSHVGKSDASATVDRLLVRCGGVTRVVRVGEIDWVEATRNYVNLHSGREVLPLRVSIGKLASALDPARFARIHRSTIVNLDRVKEMQPWFSGDHIVVMRDGTQLRLSRRYRLRLISRLSVTRTLNGDPQPATAEANRH